MSERTRVRCFVSSVAVGLLTAGTALAQKGDANNDGMTDDRDLNFVTERLGCSVENDGPGCVAADVNCDGAVNPFDMGFVNAHFGARDLLLMPIPGLTSGIHPAPPSTPIPLGSVLRFRVELPPDADIAWTGAVEIRRDQSGSTAECPLNELGLTEARADIALANGLCWDEIMFLNVVDIPVEAIQVGSVAASVSPLALDESSSNEETMEYYFGESIASLTELSPGRYLTSIDRTIQLSAIDIQPPMFAPLIEWRVDGTASALGAFSETNFLEAGPHAVSSGPPAGAATIRIDTYSVTIISHDEDYIIPEGEPVTFEAATDPPGYENHITWLSSTKYGTAVPVLGQGPTFTTQFDNTFGPHPDGGLWQWLGVKGDDFPLGQDQKCQTDDDCTAECHSCVDGECVDDQTKCPAECHICVLGVCEDDESLCPGECECCEDGSCVDEQNACDGCEKCVDGDCVDDQTQCPGECDRCINGSCLDDDTQCFGCQRCTDGTCFDEDSACAELGDCCQCLGANCEDHPLACDVGLACVNCNCVP